MGNLRQTKYKEAEMESLKAKQRKIENDSKANKQRIKNLKQQQINRQSLELDR